VILTPIVPGVNFERIRSALPPGCDTGRFPPMPSARSGTRSTRTEPAGTCHGSRAHCRGLIHGPAAYARFGTLADKFTDLIAGGGYTKKRRTPWISEGPPLLF
jgi:hypothetical protein